MLAPRGDHSARADKKVPQSGWPEESASGASICPQESLSPLPPLSLTLLNKDRDAQAFVCIFRGSSRYAQDTQRPRCFL